jgi:hypothetical protein
MDLKGYYITQMYLSFSILQQQCITIFTVRNPSIHIHCTVGPTEKKSLFLGISFFSVQVCNVKASFFLERTVPESLVI